ncbi:LOW QUALITY PROTEIN: ABC-type multidrug transport system, ATPase and permease component [Opitutaceae bacterium TAV1]|nr:LOW QUALITY PROTEIN: ABC-type multidrug transport system, ATPase and permease component [Opitutaceae bacterium TAV1]
MRALRQLLPCLRGHWFPILIAPLLMTGEVVLDLLQPRFVQHIIDQGIGQSDLATVTHTAFFMLAAAVGGLVCGGGCGFFAVRAGLGFGASLRRSVFHKVQSLSFADLDRLETGPLITRLTSDVNQVQDMAIMLLRGMVRTPLLLVGSIVMAVLTSPRLSLLFLVIIPILVTALVIISRKTFPLYRQVQQGLDDVNTVLQENLAGSRVVKAFARAGHESERFARVNHTLVRRTVEAIRTGARLQPFMMLTLNVGIVAVLWAGAHRVRTGDLQVGEIVAFINYLMHALMSLAFFSFMVVQMSRAHASVRRIAEILEARPSLKSPSPPRALPPRVEGRVAFENVSFSYAGEGGNPVLKNISFTAGPGQTVAILGATGSGKSTLAHLIPRFYDATEGRVTLDGVDVRDIPEADLHRHVGIALQEPVLFGSTVGENIAFARPDAPPELVADAARTAQADTFISHMPEGYATAVGQRGVTLSGGQKIARALLPRPAVLILDDSTSAVDLRTESFIRDALSAQDFCQTRIIIAQRISTVVDADRILVLDEGQLVAAGTHATLLETSPVYREIYQSQIEKGATPHEGE